MTAHETFKLLKTKKVSIIGVPFNGGQPQEGVEKGPLRLVESGLAAQLEELGWETEYEGNDHIEKLRPESDPVVNNLRQPKFVSAVTRTVAGQILERAKQGNFVLTLGGDHSVGIATVSGVLGAYPNACLIWVDAHAVSEKKKGMGGKKIYLIRSCRISIHLKLLNLATFMVVLLVSSLVYLPIILISNGSSPC